MAIDEAIKEKPVESHKENIARVICEFEKDKKRADFCYILGKKTDVTYEELQHLVLANRSGECKCTYDVRKIKFDGESKEVYVLTIRPR